MAKLKIKYTKQNNGYIADLINEKGVIVASAIRYTKSEAKAAAKAALSKIRRETKKKVKTVKRSTILTRLRKVENVLIGMAGSRESFNKEAAKGSKL